MNELIDSLKQCITDDNQYIIKDLINIINKNSLNSINDLIKLEDNNFTIDGNVLSRNDRVDYCYNNIINSYYDADALDFEVALNYSEYYDLLKKSILLEDKVKYVILLYSITGREQLLVYELYKSIIDKNI